VEIDIQTEAIPISADEDLPPPPPIQEVVEQEFTSISKKMKLVEEKSNHLPPVFVTPLIGATVTEGVKFTFECRFVFKDY